MKKPQAIEPQFKNSRSMERESCVVIEGDPLEPLHTFENFPVMMICTREDPSKDRFHDMSWWIGRRSGTIQLKNPLPLEVVYAESHGSGLVGRLWDRHHSELAEFIREFSPGNVLEIGGGHGILSIKFHQMEDVPWTIIEPNPKPVSNCRAKITPGFFTKDTVFEEQFDTVVHSHVLEHIYEPNMFMNALSRFMSSGHRLIFSVPNMKEMLKRKYTNCLNFEHTILVTEEVVEFLLSQHGFRVLKKKYFLDDHSIFFAAEKSATVDQVNLPEDFFAQNRALFLGYLSHHKQLIQELNAAVKVARQPVFLFGAHVFAQFLIAFGLDTSALKGILDNDPNKQGKRLYGTNLLVSSPKILADIPGPIVILRSGVYNAEIKKDILEDINSSTQFLE